MVHQDTQIANSKAIVGAVFIQYVFYGCIYIMEGIKYNEIHSKGPASSSNQAK